MLLCSVNTTETTNVNVDHTIANNCKYTYKLQILSIKALKRRNFDATNYRVPVLT